MSTWSPSAIWPISVSSTVAFTTYELVPTTTIWALDDPVPVPVPVPVLPVPPLPVPPLPDPVPLTCWPTFRLTEATVPAMVDVRAPSFRAVWAFDRDDSAEVTAA